MALPFDGITVFLYSFYALVAISVVAINSINIAVTEFKKGTENAWIEFNFRGL